MVFSVNQAPTNKSVRSGSEHTSSSPGAPVISPQQRAQLKQAGLGEVGHLLSQMGTPDLVEACMELADVASRVKNDRTLRDQFQQSVKFFVEELKSAPGRADELAINILEFAETLARHNETSAPAMQRSNSGNKLLAELNNPKTTQMRFNDVVVLLSTLGAEITETKSGIKATFDMRRLPPGHDHSWSIHRPHVANGYVKQVYLVQLRKLVNALESKAA